MKSKKQKFIVAFAVLFLVIIAGVRVYNGKSNDSNKVKYRLEQEDKNKQFQEKNSADIIQNAKESEQIEKEMDNKPAEEEVDLEESTEDDEQESPDLSVEEAGVNIDINAFKERNEESSVGESEEEKGIVFPYTIPDTNLVVTKISDYKGIYVEDGKDTEVQSVCAMLVTNSGTVSIEYAEITVKSVNEQWNFNVSTLPSGASVVVQEANGMAYQETEILSLEAECAEIEEFEMSAEQVKVEETADGSLRVTNLTDQEIPCVRIFYKFYMQEENVYVGGITYVSKITDLEANSSREVNAKHYLTGSSKIMMIRTYDSF